MKKTLLTLLLVTGTLISYSQKDIGFGVDMDGHIPKGLNVGDNAPMFELSDANGEKFNSENLLKDQQLIVIFYRGEWCPVCSRYLSNLNDSLSYLKGKNAMVVAIGPELPENVKKTAEKTEANFLLLSDEKQMVSKDYDVLFDVTKKYTNTIKTFLRTDIAENNGSDKAQLPVPATFIIGKDGKIKFKQFDYNYKNRASVKEMLEHL